MHTEQGAELGCESTKHWNKCLETDKTGKARIAWKCSSEVSDAVVKPQMGEIPIPLKAQQFTPKRLYQCVGTYNREKKKLEYVQYNNNRGQNHIPK